MTYTAPWRRDRVSSILKVEREGGTEEFNSWSDDGTVWDQAGADPTLDLFFAARKDLKDQVSGNDLITFTRASDATVIGSDGLIQDALNRTNLLLRSQEFDNASWVNFNSTDVANAAVAPDGTTTADKIIGDAGLTNASSWLHQDVSKAASAITYTYSVYAKAAEFNTVRLLVSDPATGITDRALWDVNLSTGLEVSAAQAAGTFTLVGTSIVDAENGWYRLAITFTTGTETSIRCRVYDYNTPIQNGDGTSGIFVWGAQLEERDEVTDYIATEGSTVSVATPRFQHDPTTGECQGLLGEGARTNLYTYSEDFGNAAWTKTACTATTDDTTAPDGTLTADRLVTTADAFSAFQRSNVGDASVQNTVSVYVKRSGTCRYINIHMRAQSASVNQANFEVDLLTGTEATVYAGGGTATRDAVSIEALPDDWYRLTMTVTLNQTGACLTQFSPRDSPNNNTSLIGNGVYMWGAQFEAGPYPTSYIPTEGSQVTRAADVVTIDGANLTSFYSQTEGSIRFEGTSRAAYAGANLFGFAFQFDDGGTANRISLDGGVLSSGYRHVYAVAVASVVQATLVAYSISADPSGTSAFAYATNDFAAKSNRSTLQTDGAGTLPTISRLQIGVGNGGHYDGAISRITYWTTRLDNDTLQALTP